MQQDVRIRHIYQICLDVYGHEWKCK